MFIKSSKRSQQTGAQAAVLVALIALFIVLYVMFLPPSARRELLTEGRVTDSTAGTVSQQQAAEQLSKALLSEKPGRVSYLKNDEIERELGSVNLYTKTEGSVLKDINTVYVEKALFTELYKNETFEIPYDLDNVDNVLLNFFVSTGYGVLEIKLNGQTIYTNEIAAGIVNPISLKKPLLKFNNLLEFSVSSPGLAFWRRNRYILEGLKITADVTDVSKRESKTVFIVNKEEKDAMDTATIKFTADCTPREVGKLSIEINGDEIYSAVPDCGQLEAIEFLPYRLVSGENILTFNAASGSYIIDRIVLRSKLKEPKDLVYYFELDEEFFKESYTSGEERCGEIDGVCPEDCEEDEDKDCCFKYSENFWCDVETDDLDDRCAVAITTSKCSRCSSGYEDDRGDPPEACEEMCGDDTDNACPSGCSIYYDKDCCDELEYFWCDDVPTQGLSSVCEKAISEDECDDCPAGYESEDGSPSCKGVKTSKDIELSLKKAYDIELVIKFADAEESKEADIIINGKQFTLDTRDSEFKKNINSYVEEGFNSVKIIPRATMDIRSLEVKIES